MAGGGQNQNLAQLAQQLQGAGGPQGSNMSTQTQNPYNNFASPNQNFMQYQGQGQPNVQQGPTGQPSGQGYLNAPQGPANRPPGPPQEHAQQFVGNAHLFPPPPPQGQSPSNIGATPQNQNFMQGADATGTGPGNDMGFFDKSGSDGGQGGQPAPMQTPFAPQGNKPPSMANFQQPQGLQIQGNPTSQVVQRPQQR
jgi:hypothetical protein